MYNNWRLDLKDSCKAIESIKHDILPKVIKGDIISLEESDNETLLLFDKHSGIDYIRKDSNGIQGIASRVQFGKNWDSFTVRYKRKTGSKTEYEKRVYQIEKEYLYPYLTMQCYFDNKKDLNLLSLAVMKTKDLFFEIENNIKVKERTSDNVFKYLNWCDIPKEKIRVITT